MVIQKDVDGQGGVRFHISGTKGIGPVRRVVGVVVVVREGEVKKGDILNKRFH